MKSKRQICILAGIACLGISSIASASAIGQAEIGPCAPSPGGLTGATISITSFTWHPATLGGTGGCFITGSPATITSTQPTIISGDTGNLLNLTAGSGAVDDFITFNGTNLDFVLTAFAATATNNTACDTTVGDTCIVVSGFPLDLENISGGVEAAFTMLGTITDGGILSNWSALFTMDLPGETDADIQNKLLGLGQTATSISGSFAARLTIPSAATSAPEPGTASMLLLAGVGMIGVGRKQFGKR